MWDLFLMKKAQTWIIVKVFIHSSIWMLQDSKMVQKQRIIDVKYLGITIGKLLYWQLYNYLDMWIVLITWLVLFRMIFSYLALVKASK